MKKFYYHHKKNIEINDIKKFFIRDLKKDKLIIISITLLTVLIPFYLYTLVVDDEYLIITDPMIYGVSVFFVFYFVSRALHNFYLFTKRKNELKKFQDFVYDIILYDNYLSINIKDLQPFKIYFEEIKKIFEIENTIYLISSDEKGFFSFNKKSLLNIKSDEFEQLLKSQIKIYN